MPKDKSLYHYGSMYNRLIDPLNKQTRDRIVDLVPEGASVLDVGCGTGALCFQLRGAKQCSVVGADLSLRMVEFGRTHSPFDDIQFLHQDATDLVDIGADSFDYVIASLILHELNPEAQRRLIDEAWRVGRKCVLADSAAPLSWNSVGVTKRALEYAFGFEHRHQFRGYLSAGGIMAILKAVELDSKVVYRDLYSLGCNQVVVIAH